MALPSFLRRWQGRVAVADADSPAIRVYVSDGTADAVGQFDGHSSPVLTLAYNEPAKTVVSADRSVLNVGCLSCSCRWRCGIVGTDIGVGGFGDDTGGGIVAAPFKFKKRFGFVRVRRKENETCITVASLKQDVSRACSDERPTILTLTLTL